MNSSSIFITTTIPYVNAAPHVGHAQEFVLADSLARLYRSRGHRVRFQTGTDENAFKNVLSARLAGVEPNQFVTLNAAKFRALADRLEVSYDTFIRTSDDRHRAGVQAFWRTLDQSDLYSKAYQGLYCQGCEDFVQEKDLTERLCPDHRTPPQPIAEENIFFRLSRYQSELEKLIADDRIKITPSFRKAEILAFIRGGLHDISVTRSAARSEGWGIVVPDQPSQVIYVWIDALINYLTGLGYGSSESWRAVWSESNHKVHVIGKNVWKFHAVYWPALLLSAGLPLPDEIVIHGFLTVDGAKISKSLGNAIDPSALVEAYGVEALRNYLLAELSVFSDSDFSQDALVRAFNTRFANTLGNLVSRLAALARRAGLSTRFSHEAPFTLCGLISATEIPELINQQWNKLSEINAEINRTEPWALLKRGERAECVTLLNQWLARLAEVAGELECFVPTTGRKLREVLVAGIEKEIEPLYPRLIDEK
jgi:methionyl-tRNA synthetase